MSEENLAEVAAEIADQDGKRERSKIAFPYNDLKDAINVAQAIWANVGAGTCDMAQLAAWLKHDSVNSGAFRLKVAATKTFGLITTKQGSITLTKLGREIIDPQQASAAKAEAFLTVPLYRELYGKYTGILLPNPVGLEREIADLGVATKQTNKARQAFQRSAQEAGFFKEGNNKLVRPGLSPAPDPSPEPRAGGGGGGGGGDSTMHPFVKGLVDELPAAGSDWSDSDQKEWLEAAQAIFKLLYNKRNGAA